MDIEGRRMGARRPVGPLGRWARTAAVCLAGAAVSGCLAPDFQKLRPGQNHDYDIHLADLSNARGPDVWLWVRERLSADFDGEPRTKEEAVLATFQEGPTDRPGPMKLAVLLFFRKDAGERSVLVSRRIVFEEGETPPPPHPSGVLVEAVDAEWAEASGGDALRPRFTEAVLGAQEGREAAKGVALVSLLARQGDGGRRLAWHFGFAWPEDSSGGPDDPVLAVSALQAGAAAWFVNRGPRPAFFNEQRVLPSELDRYFGATVPEPAWLSVWGRDADGVYRQADGDFRRHFASRTESWLGGYAHARIAGARPEALAYFEYYLGRLKRLLGENEIASAFFREAGKNAGAPSLREAANKEIEQLAEAGPVDPEAASRRNSMKPDRNP